jgi:hypothetical protein
MDAADVLQEMWNGSAFEGDPEDEYEEEDQEMVAMRAPFSRQFPGLARAEAPRWARTRSSVCSPLSGRRGWGWSPRLVPLMCCR